MGANSSKHTPYPFPHHDLNAHGKSHSVWSFVGKGKKAKRQSDSKSYYVPGGYSYVPQPYVLFPQQSQAFSSSYYPHAAQMSMPQPASQAQAAQPNMRMPVPNAAIAPPAGQSYDPVIPPPPIVSMLQPPQGSSGVPPPPQMQYESFGQQPQQQSTSGVPPPPQMQYEAFNQQPQQQAATVVPPPPQVQYEAFGQQSQQQAQEQYQPQEYQPQEYQPQQQDQQQGMAQQPPPQPPPVIPPNPNGYPEGPPSAGIYGPPGPRPRTPLSNPLPTPPRDLYEMSPYRSLLKDLPATTQMLERRYSVGPSARPQYDMQQTQRHGGGLGALLGSKKKGGKGLFRSSSSAAGHRDMPQPLLAGMMGGLYGGPLQRSNTQNSYLAPPSSGSSHHGAGLLGGGMPVPTPTEPDPNRPPPVRFDHMSPLSGFMNHSAHRVLYQNHTYPSALHLLEALKFLGHRPDLADRIRGVRDVQDVYPLSASMQEFVRSDWGQVFLQMVEEVLYMKFKQHPDLRNQLMNTGTADIIYSEPEDAYWGEGSLGQGTNELGKSIMRVRERLRREGYTGGPPSSGRP